MTNTSTLYDLLLALRPPLELLDHLTRYQGRAALPDQVVGWLERWRRIYAGEPDPLLDALTDEPTKGECVSQETPIA